VSIVLPLPVGYKLLRIKQVIQLTQISASELADQGP
jgi:hypothetical protein